ncbi:hypothetical protein [Streptomyces sp. NPDC101234]|uniref:hypothetical protein n=1 Tax=Streptomyces sp. NPDC101234 TaxID=3366138 RepID=UPI00381A0122
MRSPRPSMRTGTGSRPAARITSRSRVQPGSSQPTAVMPSGRTGRTGRHPPGAVSAVAAAGLAATAGMAGVDAVPTGLGPYRVTGDYGFSPRAFAKQRLDS